MGVWGVGLKSSDEFAEVQDEFFDQYIEGSDPIVIAADIRKRYEEEFPDDDGQIMNTVLFSLAQSLWECGAKDQSLWDEVGDIISNGKDLQFWTAESGGDKTLVRKRKAALAKFWERLNSVRKSFRKPKKKVAPRKPSTPSILKGDAFAYHDERGYRAAVVLDYIDMAPQFTEGSFLIAICIDIFESIPRLEDVLESKTQTIFWCLKQAVIPKKDRIFIGNIDISGDYNGHAGFLFSNSGVIGFPVADRTFFFCSEKASRAMRQLLIGTYPIKAVVACPRIIPGYDLSLLH